MYDSHLGQLRREEEEKGSSVQLTEFLLSDELLEVEPAVHESPKISKLFSII